MLDQRLISYIKEARLEGQTDSQIRAILLENTFKETDINEAFAAINPPATSIPGPAPVVVVPTPLPPKPTPSISTPKQILDRPEYQDPIQNANPPKIQTPPASKPVIQAQPHQPAAAPKVQPQIKVATIGFKTEPTQNISHGKNRKFPAIILGIFLLIILCIVFSAAIFFGHNIKIAVPAPVNIYQTQTKNTAAPSATIDQTSLTTTSAFPTITGIASNVSSVSVDIDGAVPSDGSNSSTLLAFYTGVVPVINGQWSFTTSESNFVRGSYQGLSPGTYTIFVGQTENSSLATGALTVNVATAQ